MQGNERKRHTAIQRRLCEILQSDRDYGTAETGTKKRGDAYNTGKCRREKELCRLWSAGTINRSEAL
jgi:hypothetical protein